jgi:hypothetical protein
VVYYPHGFRPLQQTYYFLSFIGHGSFKTAIYNRFYQLKNSVVQIRKMNDEQRKSSMLRYLMGRMQLKRGFMLFNDKILLDL